MFAARQKRTEVVAFRMSKSEKRWLERLRSRKRPTMTDVMHYLIHIAKKEISK